jgi:hypothetical protein
MNADINTEIDSLINDLRATGKRAFEIAEEFHKQALGTAQRLNARCEALCARLEALKLKEVEPESSDVVLSSLETILVDDKSVQQPALRTRKQALASRQGSKP